MKNPLRSEAEAYRFLLLTIAYFAAIVLASLAGNRWIGLAVFVLLTVGGAWRLLRTREPGPRPRAMPAPTPPEGGHRILVVANETVGGGTLREAIRERSEGRPAEILVVAPALNSPLKHWVSDEDAARIEAQERLDASLGQLAAAGIEARGEVGDAEPLQAIEDAFRTYRPDEIIISTHPEGRSNWLEQDLVARARERFAVPITHVVVDLGAEQR